MVQAVTEAVQEAVQAARDEGIKFDVRANLYTLLAISGEPDLQNDTRKFIGLPRAKMMPWAPVMLYAKYHI